MRWSSKLIHVYQVYIFTPNRRISNSPGIISPIYYGVLWVFSSLSPKEGSWCWLDRSSLACVSMAWVGLLTPIDEPWTMTKWPSHTLLRISTPKTTRGHPKTNRCNVLHHRWLTCAYPHYPHTSRRTHKKSHVSAQINRPSYKQTLEDLKCSRCGFVSKIALCLLRCQSEGR